MVTGKDFFYCYNYKLNNYLQSNGFKYVTRAINTDNHKVFNMYYVTDQLSNAINSYKQMNK